MLDEVIKLNSSVRSLYKQRSLVFFAGRPSVRPGFTIFVGVLWGRGFTFIGDVTPPGGAAARNYDGPQEKSRYKTRGTIGSSPPAFITVDFMQFSPKSFLGLAIVGPGKQLRKHHDTSKLTSLASS